jgi:hypothetical protein
MDYSLLLGIELVNNQSNFESFNQHFGANSQIRNSMRDANDAVKLTHPSFFREQSMPYGISK